MASQNGSLIRFHEGQEVRIICDNPYINQATGTILRLTDYGAIVLTDAANSCEFRTLNEEMEPLPSTAPGTVKVKDLGYNGYICDHCGGSRLRQTGNCWTCDDCGTNGGCS